MLTAIKLLHTLIWAFLAASIMILPIVGVLRRFRCAAILTGLILLECGVLALNGGRCPLSDLAARFTNDRAQNFDIYLPNWLAQHNKVVFGLLFVAGELIVLACWLRGVYRVISTPERRLTCVSDFALGRRAPGFIQVSLNKSWKSTLRHRTH